MKQETNKVGALALITGVALGALGTLFIAKVASETLEDGVLKLYTNWSESEGESNEDGEGFEDVSPDTATLIDSLENITVQGTEADLVKVRVLGLERAKAVAMWGSKGVTGVEPTQFQRFADLSTEHLLNIKRNSLSATPDDRRIIDSILEDRVASGAADEAVLSI